MGTPQLPKNHDELAALLGYSFKTKDLLLQALRHPSYVYESGALDLSDNQTLEFLGDAVINLAISHLLMRSFPEMKEGDLSKCRASLVSESGLHSIALELQLGDYLLLGRGEERTQGRKKPSILADAFEALVGAIYLDGGFSRARRIIAKLFAPLLNDLSLGKPRTDFKTDLQEFTQVVFQVTPEYKLEKEMGPDHNKTFYIAAYLEGKLVGKGNGKSKKEAEQEAAKEALTCLRNE
jgi:ribonuclease-3